jgi:NAD-dependent dihydropyrimidine dehydrogenase PreA subunit
MDKPEASILVDYAKCAPCAGLLCVGVCPQGILEIGANGKPRVVDAASCTQCAVCVDLCPSKALIIVVNSEKSSEK